MINWLLVKKKIGIRLEYVIRTVFLNIYLYGNCLIPLKVFVGRTIY